MNKHLKETIAMIKYNAEMSIQQSNRILQQSSDYFAKHQASDIKAKNEDTLKMVGALNELLKKEAA